MQKPCLFCMFYMVKLRSHYGDPTVVQLLPHFPLAIFQARDPIDEAGGFLIYFIHLAHGGRDEANEQG